MFPIYDKGKTPCKYCIVGSHTQCYKLEYCSCNCPFIQILLGRNNQNTKKTHCKRGHELLPENLYSSARLNHRICKLCAIERRVKNREKLRIQAKNHYHKNKKEISTIRRIMHKSIHEKLKREVLTYYGNGKLACICCSESIYEMLSIDHIDNNGSVERKKVRRTGHLIYKHLKKFHFPKGYQTLCFNCNMGKQINKGICPHKTIKTIPVNMTILNIRRLSEKNNGGDELRLF